MTYPDRLSVSTSVPYTQTTRMGAATMRFENVPGSIPLTMSSVSETSGRGSKAETRWTTTILELRRREKIGGLRSVRPEVTITSA